MTYEYNNNQYTIDQLCDMSAIIAIRSYRLSETHERAYYADLDDKAGFPIDEDTAIYLVGKYGYDLEIIS